MFTGPESLPIFEEFVNHPRIQRNAQALSGSSHASIIFPNPTALDFFSSLSNFKERFPAVGFAPTFPVRTLLSYLEGRGDIEQFKAQLFDAALVQDELEVFKELETRFGEFTEFKNLFRKPMRLKIPLYCLVRMNINSAEFETFFNTRLIQAFTITSQWRQLLGGLRFMLFHRLVPSAEILSLVANKYRNDLYYDRQILTYCLHAVRLLFRFSKEIGLTSAHVQRAREALGERCPQVLLDLLSQFDRAPH